MSEPEIEKRARPRIALPISRHRLIELGVVVFGVMIALGLENLIEEVRLRGDAQQLEQSFRDDIFGAVQQSWERQAVDPCLTQTLSSLMQHAASPIGEWDAAPGVGTSAVSLVFPAPYVAPIRVWTTASFDRALGSEAFKRIPRERADYYAVMFAQIEARRQDNMAEYSAISRLIPLAFPQAGVDAEVRVELMQALAQLDRHRGFALLQSEQIIALAFSMPGSEDVRAEVLKQRSGFDQQAERTRTVYGDCFDRTSIDRLMTLAAAS